MEKTPKNPSKSATKRVKNPLPIPTVCNCCGGRNVEAKLNSVVYRGREYGDWPWVYICDDCKAYVGLHPFTAIPLGTLADQETRTARNEGKKPFQELFNSGLLTRTQAYQRLASELKIPVSECHFGWFDANTAIRAGELSLKIMSQLKSQTVSDKLKALIKKYHR